MKSIQPHSFNHWQDSIVDVKVDIQHLFSWQGVFNLSASNIERMHIMSVLYCCYVFTFYFLLLSVYFEAVILMASKNTHTQEKD